MGWGALLLHFCYALSPELLPCSRGSSRTTRSGTLTGGGLACVRPCFSGLELHCAAGS